MMFLFTILADLLIIIISGTLGAFHANPSIIEQEAIYGRWVTVYLGVFLVMGIWACTKVRSRYSAHRFLGLICGFIPLFALETYFIYLICN